MQLESLQIEQFRSLESVKLENLGRVNVLVGRNNVGKSAVLNALDELTKILTSYKNGAGGNHDWREALSKRDTQQILRFNLDFTCDQASHHAILKPFESWLSPSTIDILRSSQFLKKLKFIFESYGSDHKKTVLRTITASVENGQFDQIFTVTDGSSQNELNLRCVDFSKMSTVLGHSHWPMNPFEAMERHGAWQSISPNISNPLVVGINSILGHQTIFETFWKYVGHAFLFNPFRHSEETQPSSTNSILARNGSNLAQVLYTLRTNREAEYAAIERFVQEALPGIGTLHTRTTASSTHITFNQSNGIETRLPEMGGGVEQLLMVATVLHSTDLAYPIYLEEPESHLHPGAQRYLLEKLLESGRQVFITTHSPVFVNTTHEEHRVYRVTREEGRSSISRAVQSKEFGAALEDLGARNSDVLLSDGVIWVEGPTDIDIITAWSDTLNINLAGRNIRVQPMGGGTMVEREGPIRATTLESIAQMPIGYVILVDRDHRTDEEIQHLQIKLGDRIHVLQRRELENYLLVPSAIASVIQTLEGTSEKRDERSNVTPEEVQQRIATAANALFNLVLIKRIRSRIGHLRGGWLDIKEVKDLIPGAAQTGLGNRVVKAIQARLKAHFDPAEIKKLVTVEQKRLKVDWSNPGSHTEIAPGEEILQSVFSEYGVKFSKTRHGVLIAKAMNRDEIAPELVTLLEHPF
jgi:predicted ATPase